MGDTIKTDGTVLDHEVMEKSFNDSVDTLSKLLNGDQPEVEAENLIKSVDEDKDKAKADGGEPSKEELEKAKDKGDYDDKGEEEDEEDEEGKPAEAKKSLEDAVAENPEAEAAMDIEPFLRQLVKGIDEKFESIESKVNDVSGQVGKIDTLQKAVAKVTLSTAELQKAMGDTVEKIGETPVPSNSVLRKAGDRFEGAQPQGESILDYEAPGMKERILDKAITLGRNRKLDPVDVTKIEARLNKGMALEPRHEELIKAELG